MSFVRAKTIKGHRYFYLQASHRVGSKVVSQHIKYLGKTARTNVGDVTNSQVDNPVEKDKPIETSKPVEVKEKTKPSDYVDDIRMVADEQGFSLKEHIAKGGSARSGDLTRLLMSAGMSREQVDKFGGVALYLAYKDDVLDASSKFQTKWGMDIHSDERDRLHGTAYLLGWLSQYGLKEGKDEGLGTTRLFNFVSDLREKTGNDTIRINGVLKYMNSKVRVTKKGEKGQTSNSPINVKEKITSHDFKDFKYFVSGNFRKSSLFKSDTELHESIIKSLDKLPEFAKKEIQSGNTKITFIGRKEIKALGEQNNPRALAYYEPRSKQIYVFPTKLYHGKDYKIKRESLEGLKKIGYDDTFINKLKQKVGRDKFEDTIIHEFGHAVALNSHNIYDINEFVDSNGVKNTHIKHKTSDNSIKFKYDEFRRKTHEELQYIDVNPLNISDYAGKNSDEDFAEHFAYYGHHKDFINQEIGKGKSEIFSLSQLKKFKWFKEEVWDK